jgi:outer membrane protein W
MKTMKVAIAAVLLFCASTVAAQDRNVKISLFISQAEMQGETDFDGSFPGMLLDFEDADGFGVSANAFLGSHFSVEGAVFNLRSDAAIAFDDTFGVDLGTMNLTPITLGVQFHLLGDSRFDPYIGAGGAYVIGDDLLSQDTETAGLGRIELENQATYYLNAGIAFQITEGFGLIVDGRQIQYEPSSRSSVTGVEQDLEISPRILSAGVRLRF